MCAVSFIIVYQIQGQTRASGGYPPSPNGLSADSSQTIPVMVPTEDSHYSPPKEVWIYIFRYYE